LARLVNVSSSDSLNANKQGQLRCDVSRHVVTVVVDVAVDRLIGTTQQYPRLTTGLQKAASLSTTTQHAIVQDLILLSTMSRLISEPARRLTYIICFFFYFLHH